MTETEEFRAALKVQLEKVKIWDTTKLFSAYEIIEQAIQVAVETADVFYCTPLDMLEMRNKELEEQIALHQGRPSVAEERDVPAS